MSAPTSDIKAKASMKGAIAAGYEAFRPLAVLWERGEKKRATSVAIHAFKIAIENSHAS